MGGACLRPKQRKAKPRGERLGPNDIIQVQSGIKFTQNIKEFINSCALLVSDTLHINYYVRLTFGSFKIKDMPAHKIPKY